jgi:UDP-N-acetylglucosamine 3-dehydrogenase
MTNNKIRIGVLGTGFGQTHARIFASFPDVEVAGIVGRNAQKTREVARSLGIPGHTDPNVMLQDPQVDAIVVCYPTDLHAKYVIAALQHDKDVFCETPIAYTLEAADQMAQAATTSGRILQVALFGRFVSDYKYVHDFVQAGHLGKPLTVFANRRTPAIWGDGWDGNFILDLMLHDIDFVVQLLGMPVAVTSWGLDNASGGWEHVNIALGFKGLQALIEGSGIMPASFPFSTSLRVVGENGAIDLNWYMGAEMPVSEVQFFPTQGEPEVLSIPGYDPYEAECRYFVDCVQGQADPQLLGIDGARDSLQVALAAKRSLAQQGKSIEI